MIISESIESLLGRLQHAESREASNTLEKIVGSAYSPPDGDTLERFLKEPGACDRLVQIVERRADSETVFLDSSIACLITLSPHSRLYEIFSERLLREISTLLILYKDQYPDPRIENILCEELFKIAHEPTQPYRRDIVEAMSKVGTKEVLPTLEAILHTLEPRAKVSKAFAAQLGPFVAKAQTSFAECVVDAIRNIGGRDDSATDTAVLDAVEEKSEAGAQEVEKKGEHPPIEKLIADDERGDVEFKSSLRWDIREDKKSTDITHASLKTIAAFLNTNGGYLLIGVADDGAAVGIDVDKFDSKDKFRLHLNNVIKQKMGALVTTSISVKFVEFEGREVCIVHCQASTFPVYVKLSAEDEAFFIRSDASTTRLMASDIVKYVGTRFSDTA